MRKRMFNLLEGREGGCHDRNRKELALKMNKTKRLCFYVAPDGNDSWTGRLPQIDNNRGDGPFATVKKAVEAAREHGNIASGRIIIRGGSYYDVSVELRNIDTGLTIEAMEGETPVLYGGRKITGWKKEGNGDFWYAELPKTAKGEWDFRLLVVNGRLAKRSRLPEKETFQHLSVFDVEWTSTTGGGWARKPTVAELTTLKYREGDLGPWLDIKSAELTVYHKWDESLVRIASHDPGNRILEFSNPCGHPPGSFKYYKYVVWNTREGMKQPGQWYLDRTAGRLVYWPEPGENMEQAEVIAPTGEMILHFIEKVRNVTVKGLSLAVTNTPLITPEFGALRMPGAIQAQEGMENCRFTGLTIKNTGGHGIKLMGCCNSTVIEDCEISHTGAGGILFQNNMKEVEKNGVGCLISCTTSELVEDQPSCEILNNHVHHIGVVYTSAIAITAFNCNIIHNEVSNTPYSGICYGGLAGIRLIGKNPRIQNNIVSRVMQILNDGAAIYVTFTNDGFIRGNIVKDIQQSGESDSIRNAIYLDEHSEGWVVEGNLVINCTHPTLNHMARTNTIRNNVFISDSFLKMNIIRCKEYRVARNVLFSKGKLIFAGNPDAIDDFGGNLLYSLAGEYEEFHIDEKYRHYDTVPLRFRDGTIKADPLFVDVDHGNYDLRPESPAFGLGIGRIDVSKAGRRKIRD